MRPMLRVKMASPQFDSLIPDNEEGELLVMATIAVLCLKFLEAQQVLETF